MPKTYSEIIADPTLRQTQSWSVNFPSIDSNGGFHPRGILLWEEGAVIVLGDHLDPAEFRVTEPDMDGECIIRVPMRPDTQMLTDDEAFSIQEYVDEDQEMLLYAVG